MRDRKVQRRCEQRERGQGVGRGEKYVRKIQDRKRGRDRRKRNETRDKSPDPSPPTQCVFLFLASLSKSGVHQCVDVCESVQFYRSTCLFSRQCQAAPHPPFFLVILFTYILNVISLPSFPSTNPLSHVPSPDSMKVFPYSPTPALPPP